MFDQMTFEFIMQRVLERIPNSFDKREGSDVWNMTAPGTVEHTLLYLELENIMAEAFADTASREFLIRRAKERNIIPFSATQAVLQGVFTPANVDVMGQRFRVPNESVVFVVTAEISAGVYQVTCETAGLVGNQFTGLPLIPVDYISGLESAVLENILVPGQDEEDTEALRTRYFASFTQYGFGGNRQDYIDRTNAIAGVGATKVETIPQTISGDPNVRLVILDGLFGSASSTLIDSVQQQIDPTRDGEGFGIAPIGHIVLVQTATRVTVDIATTITLDTGQSWATIEPLVIASIEAYLLEQRQTWATDDFTTVRVASVDSRIYAVAGVVDVQNTTLNGMADNLELAPLEIPVMGVLTA